MTINTRVVNTAVANYLVDTDSYGSYSGVLISFDQTVAVGFSGSLIKFSQDVQHLSSYSGVLISFDETVNTTSSGNLIAFAQKVQTPNSNTFYNRNGYDIDIYINNILVPRNKLTKEIIITRSEGKAAELKFTMLPGTGVQNVEQYLGAPCFCNITDSTGTYRVFTGWVDNPALDIINQKVNYSCTDRRETQINQLSYSVVQSVGQFSQYVFGNPIDQADELNKRLMTTPSSFDFDAYGNYSITPWEPKSTPDFILGNSAIYYEVPEIVYGNRTRSINTVNITVNYKHQRLHQQICNVTWDGYNDFINDWFNQGSPTFPQKSTIQSAASSTSWVPLTAINYVNLWPAGGYSGIVWQPNTVTNTYAQRTITTPGIYYATPGVTSSGSFIFPDGLEHSVVQNVYDVHGNPIYDLASTTVTDTSSMLCRGAQWKAGKKFAQSVNELYSIKISSPQGIARYGIIDQHETVNINDPYDTSNWNRDKTVYNPLVTSGTAVNCVINNAGYGKGAMALTLNAVGSGNFYIGDTFTITGDESGQIYTVAQNLIGAGSGGTLYIKSPGLFAILLPQTYPINLIPNVSSAAANFFIDEKPRYANLATALSTVCLKADTTLKKTCRDVQVNFKRFIWPSIDLKHTVQTTATKIACKAKVASLKHVIQIESGEGYSEIGLLLSRAGSDSQSVYSIQYPPYEDASYIGQPTNVILQTHYGIDPDYSVTPAAVAWNGYIGNADVLINGVGKARTTYPTSFKVDYPPIDPAITQERTITYNLPGSNSGMTIDATGYLSGLSSVNIAATGTGAIHQGDSFTITGDTSHQVYIANNDILNISVGGVLSFSPGLGMTLSATTYPIVSSPPANIFTVAIPNDSLTVTF